jgi:hypothetical protein
LFENDYKNKIIFTVLYRCNRKKSSIKIAKPALIQRLSYCAGDAFVHRHCERCEIVIERSEAIPVRGGECFVPANDENPHTSCAHLKPELGLFESKLRPFKTETGLFESKLRPFKTGTGPFESKLRPFKTGTGAFEIHFT